MLTLAQLSTFCAPDNETRDYLRAPFVLDGNTYATDGRWLVRVFGIVPDAKPHEGAPKPEGLASIFAACETVGAWVPIVAPEVPARVPCPLCDGDDGNACLACHGCGEVTAEYHYRGRTYDLTGDCPVCGGGGVCGECHGEHMVRNHEPVVIGGARFQAWQLHALAALPNARILPPHKRYHPAAIQFDGGDGAIMPMHWEA